MNVITRLLNWLKYRRQPPEITGRIVTSIKRDDDGHPITITAHWEGGGVAAITHAFIEDADLRWFRRERDTFVLLNHMRLKIVHHDRHMGFYYVQRTNPDDAIVRYPNEVQS